MPLLAACLIVRDEQARIGACLAALAGLVDEIVVYDTGSADRTVVIAQSIGAVVVPGHWTDDFAAARNAALGHCRARWVLSVDADEKVLGDWAALRAHLATSSATDYLVQIEQTGATGPNGSSRAVKLFRRTGAVWSGRVHETVLRDGAEPSAALMPVEVLRIEHAGYADEGTRAQKSARNAELGVQELRALTAAEDADPLQVARVLLDLARSLVGIGQQQDAVDAIEGLHSLPLPPGDKYRIAATELLCRLALGDGQHESALDLTEQLRTHGGDQAYADWLAAQALAQLGKAAEAQRLLAPLTEIRDSAGRTYPQAELGEMRALVDELVRLERGSETQLPT